MKKKRFGKRARCVLLTVLTSFLTLMTGCWNYREVENLYIVGGMAIDRGTQKHDYHLTFEVLDLSGSGNGQQTSVKGKILEADGDTIADAVKNASRTSEKSLYFSDCKIVIFGRSVAEQGLNTVLDWFNRDPQPRFTVQMLVSGTETAGELLMGGGKENVVMSYQIANSLTGLASEGKSYQVPLYRVDNVFWGEGRDLVLPLLRKGEEDGKKVVRVDGSAVFRGDKYVGTMDADETENSVLLTEDLQDGILLMGKNPGEKEISLQIRKSSAQAKPEIGAGPVSMQIGLKTECTFDEENNSENYLSELGLKGIESCADAALETRLKGTVRMVQKNFGCDIFGFGRKIYEMDPDLWKKLKPDWRDRFRTLDVKVSADVHIVNSGFTYPKGGS